MSSLISFSCLISFCASHLPQAEFAGILKDFVGRESPLYFAERMTQHYAREDGTGPKVYFKREDLNHTGAHKINNAIGQALVALRIGKKRIVAETGAGQHGVATATVCARFGLQCIVYMGAQDMERQALNVFRMRLLGAEVRGEGEEGRRAWEDGKGSMAFSLASLSCTDCTDGNPG